MHASSSMRAGAGHRSSSSSSVARSLAGRQQQQQRAVALRRRPLQVHAIGRGLGADLGGKLGRFLGGKEEPKKEQQQHQQQQQRQGVAPAAPDSVAHAAPLAASDAAAAAALHPEADGDFVTAATALTTAVDAAVDAAADAAVDAAAGAADAAAGAIDAAAANAANAAAAAAPEALRVAAAPGARRAAAAKAAVEYEEVEVEVPVKGVADYAADARALLGAPATRKGLAFGAAAFLGATFAIAAYRVWLRSNSPEARRRRTVDRNKQLVQALSAYLPERRAELTPAAARRAQRASGFTPVEAFRKYLWFVLRERKFGPDAVADMVALKGALGLSDADVAEALRERAQRIYDKYGERGRRIILAEGRRGGGRCLDGHGCGC